MCLGGGSVWLGWRDAVEVSFWSFLPLFLFVITTSSHACFSLSRAQIDEAFNLERRGGLGMAWIRCFGFVLSFLVVWVRLFHESCILPLPFRLVLTRFCP